MEENAPTNYISTTGGHSAPELFDGTEIYSPTFEDEIIQNRRTEVLEFLKETYPEDFI